MLCVINSNDLLMVLGDFNPRIGSSHSEAERSQWSDVRGTHGVGNGK